MKIKIAQLIVRRDIESNKEKILSEILKVEKDEWIVFPEAILSGYYPAEEIYTKGLNWKLIQKYLDEIEHLVKDKKCHSASRCIMEAYADNKSNRLKLKLT